MAIVSTTLPIPTPRTILFNFVDIITGTGFITLFGVDSITLNNTLVHLLTTGSTYGRTGNTAFTGSTAIDLDFDIKFDKAITLEGDANFHIFCSSIQDLSAGIAVQMTFKHIDKDSNVTTIGTQVESAVGPNNSTKIFQGKYTIPRRRFSKGETFRASLTGTAVGGGNTITFMHDPKNRDFSLAGTFVTSQFEIQLPTKI